MKHLFPYYTLRKKNKYFFKKDDKRLVAIVNGTEVKFEGDVINNRILDIPMNETVHLDDYEISYKK